MRQYKSLIIVVIKRSWEEQTKNTENKTRKNKKLYAEIHHDRLQEYRRQYYQQNKERMDCTSQQYSETHKDKMQEYTSEWYCRNIQNNDNAIDYYQQNHEKLTHKYVCDVCKGHYTYIHKATHNKTKKHQQSLAASSSSGSSTSTD